MAESGTVTRAGTPTGRWPNPLLALLAVSLVLVGIAWALASPVGSSPDDNFHLASIWCTGSPSASQCERVGPGPAGESSKSVLVPRIMTDEVIDCFKFRPTDSAACTLAPASAASERGVSRANEGAYPPGFYGTLSLFVGDDVERSVVMMRLLAWVWGCVLLGGSILVADRAARPALVTGIVVSSVPMLVFIMASTNPSAWTISGSVACCFALIAGLRSPSPRRQIGSGIVAVVAALASVSARPDGGLWVGVACATALLVHYGRIRDISTKAAVPVVVALSAGAFGLLVTSAGSLTQTGLRIGGTGRPFVAVWYNNLAQAPMLWAGSLGTMAIGWFDTPMPALVPAAMIAVWAGAGAVGLHRPDRTNLQALVFLLVCAIAIPLFLLAADGSVVGEGVQPRYLLPLLPMSMAAVLVRHSGMRPVTFSRPQLVVGGTAIVLAHAVALHANMRRWITGIDVLSFDLGRDAEWWWSQAPAPMLTWFVGAMGGAGVLLALALPMWRTAGETWRAEATGTPAGANVGFLDEPDDGSVAVGSSDGRVSPTIH